MDNSIANDRVPSLDVDISQDQHIVTRIQTDPVYAQNFYAALCNNQFQHQDTWSVVKNLRWSCSWRRAGDIIADIRGAGDYLDWYCSGLLSGLDPNINTQPLTHSYVPESTVADEIRRDLAGLGWLVVVDDQS